MLSEADTQAARSPTSLPQATAPLFVLTPPAREVSYSKKQLQKNPAANCSPSQSHGRPAPGSALLAPQLHEHEHPHRGRCGYKWPAAGEGEGNELPLSVPEEFPIIKMPVQPRP